MNEENRDEEPKSDEEPAVVVIDTLDRTEYKVKRHRFPELDLWAELFVGLR